MEIHEILDSPFIGDLGWSMLPFWVISLRSGYPRCTFSACIKGVPYSLAWLGEETACQLSLSHGTLRAPRPVLDDNPMLDLDCYEGLTPNGNSR